MKLTCERCSMDGEYITTDYNGELHYFCAHHAPAGSKKLGVVGIASSKSQFATYLPLFVIFSSIILTTVIVGLYYESFAVSFLMRVFMGAFFLVFGLFKIVNLRVFADAYSTYDVISMRSRAYALVYPFIEILFALLYITDTGGIYRDVATFAIMAVSSYGVFLKLRNKEDIPCACLGMVFKIPMTWVTLVEDVLMALMAIGMMII